MEEILDPKNPWNITCVARPSSLKRAPEVPLTIGWTLQQHRESDLVAGRKQSLRLDKARQGLFLRLHIVFQ